jgi:hypothetical protein
MSFGRAFSPREPVPNVPGMHQLPVHLVIVLVAAVVVGVGYLLWMRLRDGRRKDER